MYLKELKIKNIGPFHEGKVDFAWENISDVTNPVTIITGMNGTGKSIIIDAIRAALSGQPLERNIVANTEDFFIEIEAVIEGKQHKLITSTYNSGHIKYADYTRIAKALVYGYSDAEAVNPWIVDYWSSCIPTDGFNIDSIKAINHEKFLKDVMLGKKSNVDLTNFLCHVDYLRSSDVPSEQEMGSVLYEIIRKTIDLCLDNGKFKYIRRTEMKPIVEQNGHEVTLDKLSSGNLFLIEHLVLLICKMYSLAVLCKIPAKYILNSPGLLLIDEIENHLHPRWQKSILTIIRRMFPNLQIILTTHSPFILSSLPGVKIYTCKSEPGYSVIVDETETYSSMPVDEILLSDAFNVTPFNNHISELIRERKAAVESGNETEAKRIEHQLTELNPEYFAYLDVENRLNALKK